MGREIFPVVDAGQFRLRIRAPDGTQIARTERYALDMLDLVKQEVGADNVALTLGYVGMIHSNFPVNAVYQWSRGPEEAILYVDLDEKSGVHVEELKERLRQRVAEKMPELARFVRAVGHRQRSDEFWLADADRNRRQWPQPAGQPRFCREAPRRAGTNPVAARHPVRPVDGLSHDRRSNRSRKGRSGRTYAGRRLARTDVGHVVEPIRRSQLLGRSEVGHRLSGASRSAAARAALARRSRADDQLAQTIWRGCRSTTPQQGQVLVRDVATLQPGTMPGQFDRYNMKRQVTHHGQHLRRRPGGRRRPGASGDQQGRQTARRSQGRNPRPDRAAERNDGRPVGRACGGHSGRVSGADGQLSIGATGAGHRFDGAGGDRRRIVDAVS